MKKLLLFSALSAIALNASSQNPLSAVADINVNNIRARMGVHGNLWFNDATSMAACEFPIGSGKHVAAAGSLWMGGYQNGSFVAAAHAYLFTGVDYWPGPIINGPVSYTESQRWGKIWKVQRSDINTFLASTTHTLANTPASILDWPGRENPYAKDDLGGVLFAPVNNYQRSFAPFVDVDANGLYDPLAGDYPDIVGDQALWTLFNDLGPVVHNVSKTGAMGVEISCFAFGYKRNSTIDNVVFYNYEIKNRSGVQLDSFKVGFFADMDLGYPFDDYVGYDSSRNLGITYNANLIDGNNEQYSYGAAVPKAGIQILQQPGQNCDVFKPAGSFMAFSNVPNLDPGNGVEFYNYLGSSFKNGQHLRSDGYSGMGAGPDANYIFPGDIGSGWSECMAQIPPGDRRMVIATGDTTFLPGGVINFSVALVVSNPVVNNGCPGSSFADIQRVADTAKKVFCNPLPVNTTSVRSMAANSQLEVYPNPVKNELHAYLPDNRKYELSVMDVLGRTIDVPVNKLNSEIIVNTTSLPAGPYTIRLHNENATYSGKFMKE